MDRHAKPGEPASLWKAFEIPSHDAGMTAI